MTVSLAEIPDDLRVVSRVSSAPAALEAFNASGVLGPADVHTARALLRLAHERDDDVLLAVALAVRGPRFGHVCIDLSTVHETVTGDDDAGIEVADLPWPDPRAWRAVVEASSLVGDPATGGVAPLVLAGDRLYLDRYWRYEQRIVEDLRTRARGWIPSLDPEALRRDLDDLFPRDRRSPGPGADRQRLAAATAVLRHLTVIAGGPGTGKTTTVAKILELLSRQARASAGRPPRVALAAPTGKAAARLTESLREQGRDDLEATTIHRLLGRRPGSETRFRHDRDEPLPHDVVVIDETSMVSLALMAKLLDAVRPEARLILVGDPEQLASVEAGAVLGDVVGPTTSGLRLSDAARERLEAVTRETLEPPDSAAAEGDGIGDGIIVLDRVHRFRRDSSIARLAAAVQQGDPEAAIEALASGRDDLRWFAVDDPDRFEDLSTVREAVVAGGRRVIDAASGGDAAAALEAMGDLRLLCAHRHGPYGVSQWTDRVERWLVAGVAGFSTYEEWYVGRPVIATRNDYRLGIFNGDLGVVVAGHDEAGPRVAFEGPDGPRSFGPARLDDIETVHAMTVHKSQGSQFRDVIVVLPEAGSPILTRELLYTAVTRGRGTVTVVGSEASIRTAVGRRIARASGLRSALWGRGDEGDGSAGPGPFPRPTGPGRSSAGAGTGS